MKYPTVFTALVAAASAAPLEARDGGHGGHGGAAPAPAANGMAGLAGLLGGGGFDMSSIGKLLGGDMSKIGQFVNPEMMKTYGGFMKNLFPTEKGSKYEEIAPVIRKDAKKIRITQGPYILRGSDNKGKVGNSFSFDPSGTGYMYNQGPDFPRNITIIAVESGAYDEDFKKIDIGKGLYNHHNIFYDLSTSPTSMTSCASGKGGYGIPVNIFMGGATESADSLYTTPDGKFNSGIYLKPDANIVSMIDIVNYNKEDKKVYIISEMEYIPGQIADMLPASSQIIDIGMCSGNTGLFVHAPVGKKQWVLESAEVDVTKTGWLLSSKAHLHDGAVNMLATLNGKEICDSKAIYGGEGREGVNPDGTHWSGLAGTSSCPTAIAVKKGDKLKFVANFDIEKHPERQQQSAGGEHGEGHGGMAEGMALFTASFAEDIAGGKSNWP